MPINIRVRTAGRAGGPQSIAARLFQTLFFAVFLAAGAGFCVVLFQQIRESLRVWTFPEVPALVLTSQVEVNLPLAARQAMGEVEQPPSEAANGAEGRPEGELAAEAEPGADEHRPYRLAVRYRYTADGRTYTSERAGAGGTSNQIGDLERLAAQYRPGATVTAYVDPRDPTSAVLRRSLPWQILVLGFPLIFVAVGIGGIIASWRGPLRAGEAGKRQSLSATGRRGGGLGCAAAVLGAMGVGALALLVPLFGRAAWQSLESRSWNAVPCTVVAAWVGDHGDTFSVEVLYRYSVDGREHRGSRYRFLGGSSSGWDAKQEVVATLPAGSTRTCWVDPADPYAAVLDRGLGGAMWFALIPAVFALAGFGGMAAVLASSARRQARSDPVAVLPALQQQRDGTDDAAAASPLAGFPGHDVLVLRPRTGPVGKVVGAVLLAAVVNGIVGTFTWLGVIQPWRTGGSPEGCVVLFLIPFALVALGLLLNVPYQFLAAWNPRPEIAITPGPLRVGQRSQLRWRFHGAASRLQSLELTLIGSEAASYRQGTRTTTANSTFHRETLFRAEHPGQIPMGECTVALPANTMHSFSASHNKVEWKLTLTGAIANWPDVDETFDLAVAPPLRRESPEPPPLRRESPEPPPLRRKSPGTATSTT